MCTVAWTLSAPKKEKKNIVVIIFFSFTEKSVIGDSFWVCIFLILTALDGCLTTFSVFGEIGFFNGSWWWNWGKRKKSPKPAEQTSNSFFFLKHQNVVARSKIVFPDGARQFLMPSKIVSWWRQFWVALKTVSWERQFWVPSKIVSPGDNFGCHQKSLRAKFFFVTVRDVIRVTQKKSCTCKKMCTRKKNTVGNAGTHNN